MEHKVEVERREMEEVKLVVVDIMVSIFFIHVFDSEIKIIIL